MTISVVAYVSDDLLSLSYREVEMVERTTGDNVHNLVILT